MNGQSQPALLLEREGDLARIEDAFAHARDRRGRIVVIEGMAGVGKTQLLLHSGQLAKRAGHRVLTARGHELEQDLPFGVVRQLLERELPAAEHPRQAELFAGAASLSASVFGMHRPSAADIVPDGIYGLLHGIHWLIENLSAEGPLALLVDDAQWSDELSLRALSYVGRRLDGQPVALVVAMRPAAEARGREQLLAALSSDSDVVSVRPRPLSAIATNELVSALSPCTVAADALAAIHEVTGGNPFLVVEAVQSLSEAAETITAAAVAALADSASESLSNAVMLRVGVLGTNAIAVSRAAAVLDHDAELSHVCKLSQLPRAAVLGAVTPLVQARVLADGVPLLFVHPLVRAAVYGDLIEIERAQSHARAAAVLEHVGADPARIAPHLLMSLRAGRESVAARLLEAAQDATAKGDPATAVRYWRRALAEPPSPRQRMQVMLGLGLAELASHDAAAAIEHLRAALELPLDGPQRVRGAIGLAQALTMVHDLDGAIDALDACRSGLACDALLRVDVERAAIAILIRALARDAAARMRAFAELDGETFSERLALSNAAVAHAFDPSSAAAGVVAIAARALRAETVAGDWATSSMQIASAAAVLVACEDHDAVEAALEAALDGARTHGSGFGFALASLLLAQVTVMQGRLAESIAHSEAVLATAADLPRTPLHDRFFLAAPALMLAWAHTERGEIDLAAAVIAETTDGRELATPHLCPLLIGRGLARLAASEDVRGALADFLAYGAIAAQVGYEERIALWRPNAVRAAHALGEHERAIELAQDGLRITRTWGAPGGLGAALRAAALVGVADDGDRCQQFASAVATLRASRWRLELAYALVDLGSALRRAGQRVDARAALKEGLDLAAACVARPLVERARAELRIAGARPRRDRISGRDALTPSEQRIADLAVDGHTNRAIAQTLFVTPKTVELHLSSVYRKLNITGRPMLAAALAAASDR